MLLWQTTDARKDILQRRQQREAAIKQKAPPQVGTTNRTSVVLRWSTASGS